MSERKRSSYVPSFRYFRGAAIPLGLGARSPQVFPINAKLFVYDVEKKKWYGLERGDIKALITNLTIVNSSIVSLFPIAEYEKSNEFIHLDKKYPLKVPAGEVSAEISITPKSGYVLYVKSVNLPAPTLPYGVTAKYNVSFDDVKLWEKDKSYTKAEVVDVVNLLGKDIRCSAAKIHITISKAQTVEITLGNATVNARQAPKLY